MLISIFPLLLACGAKDAPIEAAKPIVKEEKKEMVTFDPAESSEILNPTKSSGILAPYIYFTNLEDDYSLEAPLALRVRKLTINDTGVVGKHTHDTRLGYAYIISGEITEYREGSEPQIRKTGDFVVENIGLTHHWHNTSGAPVNAVVFDILTPENELYPTIPRETKLQGPAEHAGIESVEALGSITLGSTYAGLEGKVLRARMFTLAPDAVIGQHIHQERSGYVYVVEGEIVEVRNDVEKPLTRKTGDLIIEENGLEHYWENKSGAQVQLLSVDIFTPEPEE